MTVQDEDRVVCCGDNVVIRCSLTETSFLEWVVGSVVIFCSDQTCHGSTDGVHAIVTNFSVRPTDGLLTNITSSLVIHHIDESIDFACSSPVSGF